MASLDDGALAVKLLVAAAGVGLLACGDRVCDVGRASLCASRNHRDDGVRICSDEGEFSDCFPFDDCNPLTQEGCPSGTYCFQVSRTFCAPAEAYPCPPGETAKFSQDGEVVCRHFCNLDPDNCPQPDSCVDPAHCSEGEFCISSGGSLPDGIGECASEDD